MDSELSSGFYRSFLAQVVITIQHQKPKIEMKELFTFEKLENPLILADDLPIGTYVFTLLLNPLSYENAQSLKPNVTYSIVGSSRVYKIDEKTGNLLPVS